MRPIRRYKEYSDKFSTEEGKNRRNDILASEDPQYIHGGATLDACKFPVGYIDSGHLIARNINTGKYEPYTETIPGKLNSNYDNFGILNEGFNNDGVNDLVTGLAVIEGSVYLHTLQAKPTEAFRRATPKIHYV